MTFFNLNNFLFISKFVSQIRRLIIKWEGAEDGLIPNRSYYELPAGLMASCIPLEQKPFTPIDPKKLRLVPHIQPSKKLLQGSKN